MTSQFISKLTIIKQLGKLTYYSKMTSKQDDKSK